MPKHDAFTSSEAAIRRVDECRWTLPTSLTRSFVAASASDKSLLVGYATRNTECKYWSLLRWQVGLTSVLLVLTSGPRRVRSIGDRWWTDMPLSGWCGSGLTCLSVSCLTNVTTSSKSRYFNDYVISSVTEVRIPDLYAFILKYRNKSWFLGFFTSR